MILAPFQARLYGGGNPCSPIVQRWFVELFEDCEWSRVGPRWWRPSVGRTNYAEDKEVEIPLKSIEKTVPGASIMPAGLTQKLTRSELLDLVNKNRSEPGKRGVGFARFEIDVTTAGRVEFRIDDPSGLGLWLGTRPIEVKPRISLDLPRGRHRLTFSGNLANRKSDLRVELFEVASSPARAQIVNGK